MKKRSVLFTLAVSLLAACAARSMQPGETLPITNDQGHVVGHREMVTDRRTGAQTEKVVNYVPRYDASGAVVAYEEPVPDGVVIHALDGHKIGLRYGDLRSRGTNTTREGITVTVPAGERRSDPPKSSD